MNFITTFEIDVSSNLPDTIDSLVISGFLHSASTLSDSSELKLNPGIKIC